MWPTQWMSVLLGLLLVTSINAQVCSNDLAGVEDAGACCVAECVTCGGAGCGDRAQDVGLSGGDCCVGAIRDAEVYCDDSGAAPCLIGSDLTGNICSSNGIAGVEAAGVCCAPECPQCGGVGCGSQALTVGLTAADCCAGPISSSGVFCDDSGMAPCVISEPSTCSNGVFGVEADGACCVTQCGTCGGAGCSSRAADAGLTANDCCVGSIRVSDVSCDDSGEAPCLIDIVAPNVTCSNGLSGIETDGVCCVAECPQCGGVGCGSLASTAGLTSSDCCVGSITSAGVTCDDSGIAPCIIDSECGLALTVTLAWSESSSDLDLYVTEPDGTLVRVQTLGVGNVGFLDRDVRSGPGIETYTVFSGLDPDSVDVLGEYQLQGELFSGPDNTSWTLVARLDEEDVLVETGDFTGSSTTDVFSVSVTAYNPSCEGTEAISIESSRSTWSTEDKVP